MGIGIRRPVQYRSHLLECQWRAFAKLSRPLDLGLFLLSPFVISRPAARAVGVSRLYKSAARLSRKSRELLDARTSMSSFSCARSSRRMAFSGVSGSCAQSLLSFSTASTATSGGPWSCCIKDVMVGSCNGPKSAIRARKILAEFGFMAAKHTPGSMFFDSGSASNLKARKY